VNRKLLQRLVKLSKGDGEMEQGVAQFHDECMTNLMLMIDDSQKTLRPRAKRELAVIGPPQVEYMIEKEDAERRRLDPKAPKAPVVHRQL
jgi:hypothetical protein